MASEFFVVCALPYSCATSGAFHVSLFFSPKISPDTVDSQLSEWRVFRDWAQTARKDLRIELFDQAGTIDSAPLLDPIVPKVWRAAFPPTTPVRTNEVPDWRDRKWRSFAARTVHDIGKALHLATMYANPTSPVAPSGHPIAQPMTEFAAKYHRTESDGHQRRRVYDESLATRDLDGLVESAEPLAVIERIIAAEDNWLRKIALELHRCRRYYERPESQAPYRERPDPAATAKPLPQQEPEFHERCAMAGDHPALLRALGLVIDLKVTDPDRLRRAEWLCARVAVDGDLGPCRSTRVRCRAVGDDLVTAPETAEWADGALRLGDEDLFAVLDLDTDGSAIKAERFLWTLPRLLEIQANADPVNAATPALRANGFTLARTRQALNIQGRLDRQHDLAAGFTGGEPPLLSTEDIARGVRVEVWDDTAQRWASLHSRLSDVRVKGHGLVLDKLAEEGFIQGTAAHETPGVDKSPVHVHDALFGWEGWSLSAERPGKRLRHDAGDEVVEDTPTAPKPGEKLTHPIQITNAVRPGTLPRLRFGRSYAFRAWAVDLAGNSRPHELNPAPVAPPDAVSSALAVSVAPAPPHLPEWLSLGLRTATRSALESRRLIEGTPRVAAAGADEVLAHPELASQVRQRLRTRRPAPGPTAGLDRRALVADAVAEAVGDVEQPFVADTARRTPADLAALVAAHLALDPAGTTAEAAARALQTVTKLRPFLRWDPVPSPAIVPRHRYTEGESLRVLVVRSGVAQDPGTLALTVTDPETYAAATQAAHPTLDLGYRGTTQRHLAPPKTSQMQAELHGKFDQAIGSTTAADQRKMLGWALREDGSFLDQDRADIDDPPNRITQPNVRLEHQPVTPHKDLKSLPLAPGEAPAPGQYVVHDVDDLALPYLPDPLARGLSFVFAEAGLDRAIPFPFGTEGFTATYGGAWPEIESFRLVLDGGAELSGKVSGRVVTLTLPAGDQQRFRLASSLTRESLDLFGPWRSLPPSVRDNPDVAEAAADGWLWALTPFEDVLLIHAVPRPLEVPRPTKIVPLRSAGQTTAVLLGAVDVHGPSTDSLTAEASWTDPVDDLTLPKWEDRPTTGIAFTTRVHPYEDLALLSVADAEMTLPGVGKIAIHGAAHQFGDTKHRAVDYRFRASTRFREYFHPELLAPDPDVPLDDGRSVVGPLVRVSVPSSAPPAAPVVHSVLPLLRWSDGTEPEQPVARRRARRAGVRIYLQRPWFSSGAGELLGVLLGPDGDDTFGPPAEDQSGFPFVSKIGGDPAWLSARVEPRAMGPLRLDNLLRTSGFDDRPVPGRPVLAPAQLPLATLPERPTITVVGYRPQYNLERGLWYVDVAIDPGTAFWPFVRLAMCRYQPDSVADCHLSAPVRSDFVQLLPERTTTVSRTDDRHVRVVVSGPVGLRRTPERTSPAIDGLGKAVDANRMVVARLQRRDPAIDTDLGWETITAGKLTVRGRGANNAEVAWVTELDAGTTIPLARPGGSTQWRVAVEEWEMLPGDPPAESTGIGSFPIWERRLVYADHVAL